MTPGIFEMCVIRVTQARLSDTEAIEMTLRDILALVRRLVFSELGKGAHVAPAP